MSLAHSLVSSSHNLCRAFAKHQGQQPLLDALKTFRHDYDAYMDLLIMHVGTNDDKTPQQLKMLDLAYDIVNMHIFDKAVALEARMDAEGVTRLCAAIEAMVKTVRLAHGM